MPIDQTLFNGGVYTNPYGAIQQQYTKISLPTQNQPLTEEEIASLQTNGGEFDISLTQVELLRGFCTHKHPRTGALTLTRNPDNSLTCSICHQTFNEEDLTKENTELIVKRFIDLLQTIKASYPDIPITTARQFFSIIPLAKKVPNLAYFAAQNMSKYQNANMIVPGSNPYGFNALGAIMGGVPFGGGAYQYQNGYQMPMQQIPQQAYPQNQYMYVNGGYPYTQNQGFPMPMPMAQQVNVTPAGNEFGYYGSGQMAPPIQQQSQPMPGLNIQMPGVYPAAVGANGAPIFMPGTQPVTPMPGQGAMPAQQPAGQAAAVTPNNNVTAQPNTTTVSMPMATPVAEQAANATQQQQPQMQYQQGQVVVDPSNFSI